MAVLWRNPLTWLIVSSIMGIGDEVDGFPIVYDPEELTKKWGFERVTVSRDVPGASPGIDSSRG